ncbi:MAG: hypothetical protein ACI8UR_001119 [Natronomonas sp.]|jgi:hypothetical protein|uniref:DUF7473 family protein n=1 Tax=Natronomonas sp. TaxID=2184060 RepID=UPI00398950A3
MLPLQVDLVGGGPVALVVTFLVATLFSAVTLHLAALWILGDEPHQRAVKAAPVPVVIAMLFSRYNGFIVLALSFAGAFLAVRYVYELTTYGAALVSVFYYVISVIFAFAFGNIFLT